MRITHDIHQDQGSFMLVGVRGSDKQNLIYLYNIYFHVI